MLRAHALGHAAYWNLLFRGWRERDAAACEEAIRMARRTGDRDMLTFHTARLSFFQSLRSDYRAAGTTAKASQQLSLEIGNAFEYQLSNFFLAWAMLHAGEWGTMLEVLDKGTAMAARNGHRLWSVQFRLERAWLHIQAFDYAGARMLCEPALSEAIQLNHSLSRQMCIVLLGLAELGLGIGSARSSYCRRFESGRIASGS